MLISILFYNIDNVKYKNVFLDKYFYDLNTYCFKIFIITINLHIL
jgi:hypothetical protein